MHLKQGAGVWNHWRREHPKADLDFSEANLTEANLTEANLTESRRLGCVPFKFGKSNRLGLSCHLFFK
jgi:hypothetical protein